MSQSGNIRPNLSGLDDIDGYGVVSRPRGGIGGHHLRCFETVAAFSGDEGGFGLVDSGMRVDDGRAFRAVGGG